MDKTRDYLYVICLACLAVSCGEKPMFTSMNPEHTGIHFSNIITESDSINILENEYIYNGGGVGIADINQDGLPDIFLSGNMVPNKLYLNKGNFSFEDISEQAGITAPDRWASGVSVVDINADGWMDFYVSATNRPYSSARKNMLFVNQGAGDDGIPVFKELAESYGLADTSHTTHAAFFDYDGDGDLDVFLILNEMDEENQPNTYRKKILDGSSKRTDRLYQNNWSDSLDHPVFTDVSVQANILKEGFGLGVNITDINEDGWPDIYVSNDYLTNDLLYINQQDGSFIDQAADYFKHTSFSAMGSEVVDINNDGRVDIVALDMLPEDNYRKKTMLMPNNYTSYINNERFGYTHQYVRNTLQLNLGPDPQGEKPVFSEISLLSGIAATDWSWTPLIADFDLDGYRDIIITNGFPKDVTDRDFVEYWQESYNFASKEHLLGRIPSVKIPNYAYRNTGKLRFEDVSEKWGITVPSFSNGAAYVDLDQDGDLDYVVNNINDSAFVFRNESLERKPDRHWLKIRLRGADRNPCGVGAKLLLKLPDGEKLFWENSPYGGFLSSVEPVAHVGLGAHTVVDSLFVYWPDGKKQLLEAVTSDQILMLDYADASSSKELLRQVSQMFSENTALIDSPFIHKDEDFIDFNVQNLLPHKLSQFGPSLSVGDVSGDGREDIYIGGSHFHKGKFLLQQANGTFVIDDLLQGVDGEEKLEEETGTLLFDADNDGDLDLYLVSGGNEFRLENGAYQDRLFINKNGQFQLLRDALPDFLSSGSCVKAADFDRDGDLDLFVGGRVVPWEYPKATSSYLLLNESRNGKVSFVMADETIADPLKDIGMICDALWSDFDGDGWVDLILAGEWMPIKFLKNNEGKLLDIGSSSGLAQKTGWWNSITGSDLDMDGDIDYIVGNQGLNTLNKASDSYPLRMYAADFDGNGGYDAIPAVYFKGKDGKKREYPFFGRADMIKQYLPVRALFPQYAQYGLATIDQVLTAEQRHSAQVLHANYMQSSWVENLGEGRFTLHPLPLVAQFAPVFGIIACDVNGDAIPDLVLNGNDYGREVGQGRADAFYGLVMIGDGKGNFNSQAPIESGFYVSGDGKALVTINQGGKPLLASSQNQGPLQLFQLTGESSVAIALQPEDQYATIELSNGRKYRQECYYGSSFLSQSGRSLWIPVNAIRITLTDFIGNTRTIERQTSQVLP